MNKKYIDITNEITFRLQEIKKLQDKENVGGLTGEETNELIGHQEEVSSLRYEQAKMEEEQEEMKIKKNWLNRAFEIEKIIKEDEGEIEKLKARIESGFGIDYEKPIVQTSKKGEAFFVSDAVKLADVKKDYENRVILQANIKNEIRAKIDTLDSNKEKLVLILRHLKFKEWYEIQEEIYESRRNCFRIYANAIKNLDL